MDNPVNFYRRVLFWLPASMRLTLYALVTMVSAFMIQSDKMTTASSFQWGWVEWTRFLGPILSAGASTVIAFLDSTLSKLRTESETTIWKKV